MSEHCPLTEHEIRTDAHGMIRGDRVPDACVSCIMVALHGRDASWRKGLHDKTTSSLQPQLSIRPPKFPATSDRQAVAETAFVPESNKRTIEVSCQRTNNPLAELSKAELEAMWNAAIDNEDYKLAEQLEWYRNRAL